MFHRLTILLSALVLAAGCTSVKYSALEKVGVYKRDILVDRVEDAQDAQLEAKQEIASAYEQFSGLVQFDGGDLEATYKRLNAKVEDTRDSVDEVDRRIAAIERVAGDLFDEWRDELDQYSNASLRRASEQKLEDTKRRYGSMIATMKNARSRIDPVLSVFEDQVLFLKHNLNARAVAALKSEVGNIGGKVDRLIEDMNKAIAEADSFIQTMK
ncbi:MAG: DUF2959 domain-containing protein [Rhodocyclaceae bacterium]|nr:DUF2959 domain-containing protein [Rhodocyclaceae bacterium]